MTPGPAARLDGDYSRERDQTRAERRIAARATAGPSAGPVERVRGREVPRPLPDQAWTQEAKELWVLASEDEATLRWGAGDWMHLKLACAYLSRLLTPDGKRPPADGMRVLHDMLGALMLNDTAKRRAGLVVERGETPSDPIDDRLDELGLGPND
jgi:hypothetical protein